MSVFQIVRPEFLRILQIVHVEAIQVIADRADEVLAIGIPEMMRVRAHAIAALFKVHRRLARHFANVVRVFDVQQHDRLAEISQQRQLAVRRERRIVRRANAVEVLDIELALGPIETQHSRAAD